jgi:uncharacterized protein (TIGR02996 family)
MSAPLIAAIVDEPGAIGPWQVYADWLLDRGDPRGELINLAIAVESGTADESIEARLGALASDDDAWLSPRLLAEAHHWELALSRGFVKSAELVEASSFDAAGDPITVETVAALVDDPHSTLLDTLVISGIVLDDDLWYAMFRRAHQRLRDLEAFNLGRFAERLNIAAPRLERLELVAWLDVPGPVTDLVHDHVSTLISGADSCPALCTGRFALPRLQRLEWRTVEDDPILQPGSVLHKPPPSLTALSLGLEVRDVAMIPDVIPALAECPAAAQLSTLVVRPLGPADLDALVRRPSAFPRLEQLEVFPMDPLGLDRTALAALGARLEQAFPHVTLTIWPFG